MIFNRTLSAQSGCHDTENLKNKRRCYDRFQAEGLGNGLRPGKKTWKTNTSVCLSYFAVLIKQGEQETVSETFGEDSSKTSKNRKEK